MSTGREAIARAVELGRDRYRFLAFLAALLFVPLGLIGTLDDRFSELATDSDERLLLPALAAAAIVLVTSLLAQVLFAGVASVFVRDRLPNSLASATLIARRASWGRLLAIDLLTAAGTTIGLLLLLVPGLVFMGRYLLAATTTDFEDLGVRASFRRSRQISRGHGTPILVLLAVPLLLAQGVEAALNALIPFEGLLPEWISASLAQVLTAPLFALLAIALFQVLSTRRPAPADQQGSAHGPV